MGIPHLTAYLRPYGNAITLGHQRQASPGDDNASNTPNEIIIDGPALAHHIYYFCALRTPGAANPVRATPSLAAVGDAVIGWLDGLEKNGLKLQKIFFDGALPHWKRETRLSRLDAYLKQLLKYRALHSTVLPRTDSVPESSAYAVFSTESSNTNTNQTSLPAHPFLVPAVIEALSAHPKYGPVTSVVRGEADSFCAAFVREHGGVILTSDSDLLVHDLGVNGLVIFLRDVEMGIGEEAGFRAVLYRPREITERLGVRSLQLLAFELKRDYHQGFGMAVKRVKEERDLTDDPEYSNFVAEYAFIPHLTWTPKGLDALESQHLELILQRLDPRLSELVWRFRTIHEETVGTPDGRDLREEEGLDMFLPFLLDDPTRSSAWEVGVQLRTLAYSLLHFITQCRADQTISPFHNVSVMEYDRRGQRISHMACPLLDLHLSLDHVNTLLSDIQQLRSTKLAPPRVWLALVLQNICSWYKSLGRLLPHRNELLAVISSNWPRSMNWTDVHLYAQFQAALYSLRMLQQALELSDCLPAWTGEDAQRSRKLISSLTVEFETLPGFTEWEVMAKSGSFDEFKALVGMILSMESQTPDPEFVPGDECTTERTRKKRSKRRKGNHGQDPEKGTVSNALGNNKFGILEAQ